MEMAENTWVLLDLFHPTYRGTYITPFITATRDGAHPVEGGTQTFPSFMFKDLQRSVFYLLKEHAKKTVSTFGVLYTKNETGNTVEKQQKHIIT